MKKKKMKEKPTAKEFLAMGAVLLMAAVIVISAAVQVKHTHTRVYYDDGRIIEYCKEAKDKDNIDRIEIIVKDKCNEQEN